MSEEFNRLYVGKISFDTTENDLQDAFGRYGRINEVNLITDRETGRSRGFAFITFEKEKDADDAANALDQTKLHDRVINVEKARKKQPSGGRSYGSGGGGGGGRYDSGDRYGGGDRYSHGDRYSGRGGGDYGERRDYGGRDDGRRDGRGYGGGGGYSGRSSYGGVGGGYNGGGSYGGGGRSYGGGYDRQSRY